MIQASLERSSWLQRSFHVVTPEQHHMLRYHGRGIGWEGVFVDDVLVARETSLAWFVPRFDFRLGECSGVIEVRVWPWLTIRSFRLSIDGVLLYEE